MTRSEAIEWFKNSPFYDENHEPLNMAIKALQGDMYCPNCGVRLVQEDEYLEPTQTHGRLIDADALLETVDRIGCTCDGGVDINDLEGTILDMAGSDRPHGEWICKGDYAECSECGGSSGTQFDGVEPIPRITAFCPHCGADMRKDKAEGRVIE